MYYVDREQLEQRLSVLPKIVQALAEWAAGSGSQPSPLLGDLALERAVLLAIECVTDIGSLMIDGFVMRDASSYEDIVGVLGGEGVLPGPLTASLIELVKLRRPIMQQYATFRASELYPVAGELGGQLQRFEQAVRIYLQQHLFN